MKVYKYVKKKDGKLISVGDKNFEYKIGKCISAEYKNKHSGIYCYYKHGVNIVNKRTQDDFELIEMEVLSNDFIRNEGDFVCVFNRVKPLRVVGKSEYKQW